MTSAPGEPSGGPAAPVPHDPYAALRVPPFRWFILSLFAMTLGAQIQFIAVQWQTYAITHDPLSLGLLGLFEAVPRIGFAMFGGHVADRFNRRRVSLVSLAVLVVVALVFFWFSLNTGWMAVHGVWPYYGAIAVNGVAFSFLQPARNALGAELVKRELYPNAVAWRSSTWQSGAVVGPAVGGLLYGFASPTIAYAVQAILMIIALAAFMVVAYEAKAIPRSAEPIIQSLAGGIRFVWKERVLLGAQTLDLFSVFLGGAEALLPVFADQILHVGPKGLGILRAAPAAGAVLMSLYLAHRPPFKRAGRSLLCCVATFALCIVGFGLSRSFSLSLVLLLISGMADNVSVLIRSTMIQVLTPHHLLGRVTAVNSIFVGSSNELGAFESGLTARLFGTVPAVIGGGLASLGVVGIVALTVPRLRRMREISGAD